MQHLGLTKDDNLFVITSAGDSELPFLFRRVGRHVLRGGALRVRTFVRTRRLICLFLSATQMRFIMLSVPTRDAYIAST